MSNNLTVISPGRINLIGEHIDYNGGVVLPSAIDLNIVLKMVKNGTDRCNIKSENFKSGFSLDLTAIEKSTFQWHNYVIGVISEIQEFFPHRISGFDCTIKSGLPMGSGISSSAALECGIAKGLNELFEIGLSDQQMIKISRNAEHSFVGTKCGIMDQFAVVMGKKGKLIKLDCKTMEHDYVETDFAPYRILLLNTNVSHNLASSEYNTRRGECSAALSAINKNARANYSFLCDVPMEHLESIKSILPKDIYNRALYVLQEKSRVLNAIKALNNGNLNLFGEYLYRTHDGLQHLYEVSCDELNFLVDFSKRYPEVLGSRMMGGGFGGCTINLVHGDILNEYIKNVSLAYFREFNLRLTAITVNLADGVIIKQHGAKTR